MNQNVISLQIKYFHPFRNISKVPRFPSRGKPLKEYLWIWMTFQAVPWSPSWNFFRIFPIFCSFVSAQSPQVYIPCSLYLFALRRTYSANIFDQFSSKIASIQFNFHKMRQFWIKISWTFWGHFKDIFIIRWSFIIWFQMCSAENIRIPIRVQTRM